MDKYDWFFLSFYGAVILTIMWFLWTATEFSLGEWLWSEDFEDNAATVAIEIPQDGGEVVVTQPAPGSFVGVGSADEMDASLDNAEFRGTAGDYTSSVYMKKHGNIKTPDEQDAFLALGLQPASQVGGEHGYPLEGMRSGGFIPLPYSVRSGTNTNEDLAINL